MRSSPGGICIWDARPGRCGPAQPIMPCAFVSYSQSIVKHVWKNCGEELQNKWITDSFDGVIYPQNLCNLFNQHTLLVFGHGGGRARLALGHRMRFALRAP